MAITCNELTTLHERDDEELRKIYVVHPLDDVPEEKRNPDDLGPLQMTAGVRLSLLALRFYLVVMIVLVGVKAVSLAGWF
jgi:hypothetical protein